ncbi:progranulin [Excalfactoria chinensis]|uniref:progranulin n=1 Tax=Excalfactoria chinensis TaxID=46218 RepID=UPI003B3BD03E
MRPALRLWLTLVGGAAVTALQCPDGASECPQNATCCVTSKGTWGCCPMPQAVCCRDEEHCCPHGTSCDLEHGRCLSPMGDVPMATKFPAWKSPSDAMNQPQHVPAVALRRVLCPDNSSSCPDGATCCQLPSGQYGCCPLQNAVCCSDGWHCCPQGTTCDLQRSMCTSGGDVTRGQGTPRAPGPQVGTEGTSVGTSVAAVAASSSVGDVKCDEEMSCPDGDTCCRLSSGQWGCCPLEQAVCCPDHIHCCPQGYTCDPQGGTCLQGGGVRLPWLKKSPALRGRGGGVRCDDRSSCPDGSTCCRRSGGTWGCCPLEQAVCCKDHQHCCPQGYTCDIAAQSCEKLGTPPPQ